MTRVLTFSALVCLCACDLEKPEEGGTSSSETGEPASTGDEAEASEGSESSGDGPTGEAVDFGRAGQACKQPGAAADCRLSGVDGREYCFEDLFLEYIDGPPLSGARWSTCLTETCAAEHDERPCGEAGTQFCVRHVDAGIADLRWGVCNEYMDCALGETFECTLDETQTCVIDGEGTQGWQADCGFTPLVLSFGAALEFAAAPASAADFSLRGADTCARADWPAANTPWLALDRDGNGAIDDGSELFGSGSRLASGSWATDGFVALAELDSDRDGAITPADEAWPGLVLWADHDGDRRSSGWELLPLASFDVEAVELDYTRSRACDLRGNCGVERASFRYRSGGRPLHGEVIDVHLVCE